MSKKPARKATETKSPQYTSFTLSNTKSGSQLPLLLVILFASILFLVIALSFKVSDDSVNSQVIQETTPAVKVSPTKSIKK